MALKEPRNELELSELMDSGVGGMARRVKSFFGTGFCQSHSRPSVADHRGGDFMSFKKGTLVSTLSLLTVLCVGQMAAAQGRDPNRDHPRWLQGQKISSELNQEFGFRGAFQLDILSALQINRADVDSLYVIAASRAPFESVQLELNRRSIGMINLNQNLQLIQIPLNRPVSRNMDRLELVGRGNVYIVEVGALVRRLDGGPNDPETPPNPGRSLLEFRGSYEQVDVSFEGRNRSEVQASCASFMRGRNFSFVDDVKLFGSPAHLSAYLTPVAFCGWVALNARDVSRREAAYKTDLVYEGLPLEIRLESARDIMELKTDIETLAPAIQLQFVDDLKRDGVAFKLSSYLNQNGAKAFLLANLPLTSARLKAVGKVEGFPIRFEGFAREDIRQDCLKTMTLAALTFVDQVEVNGKNNRSSTYLDAQEICMIVSTNAE